VCLLLSRAIGIEHIETTGLLEGRAIFFFNELSPRRASFSSCPAQRQLRRWLQFLSRLQHDLPQLRSAHDKLDVSTPAAMYSDNNFFASAFTFATTTSSSSTSQQQLPQPPSSAALVHGSNSGGGHYNNTFMNAAPYAAGANQAQLHVHYLQVPPSRIPPHREGRTSSRSAHHHGRARSRPYIVKPIQKRLERTRRDSIPSTSSSRSRTPNLFIDQQQERPSNATPLSSSGQIHTPLANFEASFDGIAALGFDLDAFGSNERLMANPHTLSASS
jgi:hypothetical protein